MRKTTILRYTPHEKYLEAPCSAVAVGCALDNRGICQSPVFFGEIKEDGYLTLDAANRFIRKFLTVEKKTYFRRAERISLEEFLEENRKECIICVRGHYLYAKENAYWSFFENDGDDVICVWYLAPVRKADMETEK